MCNLVYHIRPSYWNSCGLLQSLSSYCFNLIEHQLTSSLAFDRHDYDWMVAWSCNLFIYPSLLHYRLDDMMTAIDKAMSDVSEETEHQMTLRVKSLCLAKFTQDDRYIWIILICVKETSVGMNIEIYSICCSHDVAYFDSCIIMRRILFCTNTISALLYCHNNRQWLTSHSVRIYDLWLWR